MMKFLENFFSPKWLTRKQKVLIVSLLFLVVLLFPRGIVWAQIDLWQIGGWVLGGIGDIAARIAMAIVMAFLQLVLLAAEAVLALGIALLSGMLDFINNIVYTDPSRNDLIRAGWTLTRDIANIGFILGLIYIGLATALQWAGFNTKKAFAYLLIMALFVNFTPLICGIVVDAANLLTNFFLRGLTQWNTLLDVFLLNAAGWKGLVGPLDWRPMALFLLLIALGFVGGGILLLYALLLFARVFVIWILVILSPLAFVAYIFPTTRRWFTTWWHQLIQWSFIGAIGGFFLYLGHLTLALGDKLNLQESIGTSEFTVNAEVASVLGALIFMLIGLYTTLQTSAMGADRIIAFGKKIGKKAPGVIGKGGIRGIGGAIVGAREATEKARREGKGRAGRTWAGFKGALKGIATPAGREVGEESFWHFLEKAHVVSPGFYERKKRKELNEYVKAMKELPEERLHEIVKRPVFLARDAKIRAAAFEALSKRKALKEEEKRYLPDAKKMGADLSETFKNRPTWLAEIGKTAEEIGETIQKISPEDFRKNVHPEELSKIEVIINLDRPKIEEIRKKGSVTQKYNLLTGIAKNFDKIIETVRELERTNPEKAERIASVIDEADHPNFI